MKKIFTAMTLALMTVAMSAQVYVGGGINAWRDTDNNTTTAGIAPEVGYKLNDKWALGMGLDCQYSYEKGTDIYRVAAMPYVRYTAVYMGPLSIFADCTAGVGVHKINGGSSHTSWQAGIKPGVMVTLTPQLSFLAHTGFLGYRDAGKYEYFGDGGFGFNLDNSDLSFGLLWNF